MLISRKASFPIDEVVKRIEKAAAENSFSVLAIHDLQAKMNSKGVPFDTGCRIIEVCNPQIAKKVLDKDIRIANALPCRITVYESGGKVVVSTIKPTVLIRMFDTSGIDAVAMSVEEALQRIIDQAVAPL